MGCKCILNRTLVKGLLLFTDGYVNMVQHHLTDEVLDPASLFSPCVCFFLCVIPEGRKKSQLPTIPWSVFMSEVRLHCNQSALIRERWGPEGPGRQVGQEGPRPVVVFAKVRIIHVCGCSTGMLWESCHVKSPQRLTDFPTSALLDKVEYDLPVFTGCHGGINVTVSGFFLKKRKKAVKAEINSYS